MRTTRRNVESFLFLDRHGLGDNAILRVADPPCAAARGSAEITRGLRDETRGTVADSRLNRSELKEDIVS